MSESRQWRIPAYGGPLDGQTITVTGPGTTPPPDLRALNRDTLRDMWRDFDATEPVAVAPPATTLYLLHRRICHWCHPLGEPCLHADAYEYRTRDQTPPRKATRVPATSAVRTSTTRVPAAPVATLTIPSDLTPGAVPSAAAKFALVPLDHHRALVAAESQARAADAEKARLQDELVDIKTWVEAQLKFPTPRYYNPSMPPYSLRPQPLPGSPRADAHNQYAAAYTRSQQKLATTEANLDRVKAELASARADLADSRARHHRATRHVGRLVRDLTAATASRDAKLELAQIETDKATTKLAATEKTLTEVAQVHFQRLSSIYDGLMGGYVTVRHGGHSITARIQAESSTMQGRHHTRLENCPNVTTA